VRVAVVHHQGNLLGLRVLLIDQRLNHMGEVAGRPLSAVEALSPLGKTHGAAGPRWGTVARHVVNDFHV
jgi:hypothetical protein